MKYWLNKIENIYEVGLDFLGGSDSKSVCLQCRRPGFDPQVGKIPWRRKWQPTPVLLPGKSHGQRSLVDYSPWGRKESDMTATSLSDEVGHNADNECHIWKNISHQEHLLKVVLNNENYQVICKHTPPYVCKLYIYIYIYILSTYVYVFILLVLLSHI